MDPVGHYDHPVRRKFHEGQQFLALYRQRGCVPFRRKRKGHSEVKNIFRPAVQVFRTFRLPSRRRRNRTQGSCLAWGIISELSMEPPYSFAEEEERRMGQQQRRDD